MRWQFITTTKNKPKIAQDEIRVKVLFKQFYYWSGYEIFHQDIDRVINSEQSSSSWVHKSSVFEVGLSVNIMCTVHINMNTNTIKVMHLNKNQT